MKYISIFDIIGPTMIGPSSSHTAGAVRIGLLARKIYGNVPKKVSFTLYNSFAKTGKGHGTDKGLIAGVLGLNVNNTEIKKAYNLAEKENIEIKFNYCTSDARHPNSVDIYFEGDTNLLVSGNSIGAGEIEIIKINDYSVNLRGDMPTLLLVYKDKPGMISKVSSIIQKNQINIATLNCNRTDKGEQASMIITLDSILPDILLQEISKIADVYMIRNIEKIEK